MIKLLQIIFRKIYYHINYKKFNPIIDYSKIDKVVFVAHPDDELIFLGNKLIKESGWLVVCMTNGDSRTRSKEFINLMNELDLQYKILNFKDSLNEKWNYNKVNLIISKIILSMKICKIVVTHNAEGEYGHFQHKELNRVVMNICHKENIMTFCKKDNLFDKSNKLSELDKQNKYNLAIKYYKSQIDVINKLSGYFEYEGLDNRY